MRVVLAATLAAATFLIAAAIADEVPFRREADGSIAVAPPDGDLVLPMLAQAKAAGETIAPGPEPEPGDLVIGRADAPVTVYEYSSYLCTDCRKYRHVQHQRVLKRLVDTGAVRFVHRDMPLSQLAFQAAVLTRCLPAGGHDRMVTELSVFQHTWGGMADPVRGLSAIALAYGVPRDKVAACLADEKAITRVADEFAAGQALFGVSKLPTFFFVRGDAVARVEGVLTLEDFKEVIAALEKAAPK